MDGTPGSAEKAISFYQYDYDKDNNASAESTEGKFIINLLPKLATPIIRNSIDNNINIYGNLTSSELKDTNNFKVEYISEDGVEHKETWFDSAEYGDWEITDKSSVAVKQHNYGMPLINSLGFSNIYTFEAYTVSNTGDETQISQLEDANGVYWNWVGKKFKLSTANSKKQYFINVEKSLSFEIAKKH